jgi:hypothetical protein
MTTIFSVVGAHQEDPDRLLMLGDDGELYQLDLPLGTPTPVEATDEWKFDPILPDLDETTA